MSAARARSGASRGCWWASAGVHGLVLAGAWLLVAGRPANLPAPVVRPLDIEWLAPAPAPVVAAAPAPVPRSPDPVAAAPALPRPEPLPQRRTRAPAAVVASPVPAVAAAPAAEPSAPTPDPAAARPLPDPLAADGGEPAAATAAEPVQANGDTGRSAPVTGPAGRAPVAAAAPAPGDEAYARWRHAFEQALRRDKRYPASARRMGQSGTVWVQLTLAPEGGAQRVAVVGSSGFRALDEAAEQLVRRVAGALQASHPPGRATELRIPIVFQLAES